MTSRIQTLRIIVSGVLAACATLLVAAVLDAQVFHVLLPQAERTITWLAGAGAAASTAYLYWLCIPRQYTWLTRIALEPGAERAGWLLLWVCTICNAVCVGLDRLDMVTVPAWLWAFLVGGTCFSTLVLLFAHRGRQSSESIEREEQAQAYESVTQQRGIFIGLVLAGIIVLSTLLHIYQLGHLPYSTDEASTAANAWYITQTGVPCDGDVCTVRGLPYLYTAAASTLIFGSTEFAVRLVGVLSTMLLLLLCIPLLRRFGFTWNMVILAIGVLAFADWFMMLAQYARMYNLFALWMVAALYLYVRAFGDERKISWLSTIGLLCVSALAILTHQFGMTLSVLIVEPLINRRWHVYRNPWFIGFASILFVGVIVAIAKVPGILYQNDQYVSVFNLHPFTLVSSRFWYFDNLGLPQWTYVLQTMRYYAVGTGMVLASIVFTASTHSRMRLLQWFVLGVFVLMAIYNVDTAPKYLWWVYCFFTILVVYGVGQLWNTRYRTLATVILATICAQHLFGIIVITQREPGTRNTAIPLIMSAHQELYHPDDKTPAEFVASRLQPTDIVITDYWVQDVYLQMRTGRKSDYFISRWNAQEFFKKFPYYNLYQDTEANQWRFAKNGPVLISSRDEILRILNTYSDRRIWYISSADFENKKYLYISKKTIDGMITTNFADNVQMIGNDGVSKVYLLNDPK